MTDVDVDHQRELEAVGLLLAGALPPRERMEVERHLRLCHACRDELVEVAALPALLRRVDPGGSPPAPPAPAEYAVAMCFLPQDDAARARLAVTAQTQLHRARRRTRTRQAVAVAAVLPAVLAGALLTGRPGPAETVPTLLAMQRVDSAVAVDGALAAAGRPWGTQLTVQMRWGRAATAVLVAVGRDGSEQPAATWAAGAGEQSLCRGATGLRPEQVQRWEVRSSEGARLLVLDA